jgi:uncharacterized membrane protein YkvA (DUF1232 family)
VNGQKAGNQRIDMKTDMDFSGFDPTTRRIAEQLANEALVSPKVLADELQQYVEELDSHKANAEFVDNDVARRIAGLCWKLLEALPDVPDERQHRLTQLAVNYFVLAEDAHDDNYSLAGFEDDLQVVTAVVSELGLDHLLEQ